MTDKKILPRDITSYDMLKCLAVILMIIDHVGFYFYPDELWFRVLGRMCVPIWFFLVGYADSRDLSSRLFIGAAILIVATAVAGMSILPLNILATIIVIRLILDKVAFAATRGRESFAGVIAMLVLLAIPTAMGVEYGTLVVICALFGYFVRHRPTIPGMGDSMNALTMIMVCMLVSFVGIQLLFFPFDRAQSMVMIGGIFVVTFGLMFFRPATFPRLSKAIGPAGRFLVQLGGRRTMEIYVLHLVAFKIAMLWLRPDDAALFDWVLYSPYGF